MDIEVYSGSELITGASRALKYRLFQNGWELGAHYRNLYRNRHLYSNDQPYILTILIAVVNGQPVASAAVFKKCHCEFQVFVRAQYRRQGIGSALFVRAM